MQVSRFCLCLIDEKKYPIFVFMQFFHQQFNDEQSIRSGSNVDDGPLRIHVGNIPFSWSDKHLREQFDVSD